jgi:hypothetical protein
MTLLQDASLQRKVIRNVDTIATEEATISDRDRISTSSTTDDVMRLTSAYSTPVFCLSIAPTLSMYTFSCSLSVV